MNENKKREASKVSRSVFVKCDEKRKALLREIYILTNPKKEGSPEAIAIYNKYEKLQQQDKWLSDALKDYANSNVKPLK